MSLFKKAGLDDTSLGTRATFGRTVQKQKLELHLTIKATFFCFEEKQIVPPAATLFRIRALYMSSCLEYPSIRQ